MITLIFDADKADFVPADPAPVAAQPPAVAPPGFVKLRRQNSRLAGRLNPK